MEIARKMNIKGDFTGDFRQKTKKKKRRSCPRRDLASRALHSGPTFEVRKGKQKFRFFHVE